MQNDLCGRFWGLTLLSARGKYDADSELVAKEIPFGLNELTTLPMLPNVWICITAKEEMAQNRPHIATVVSLLVCLQTGFFWINRTGVCIDWLHNDHKFLQIQTLILLRFSEDYYAIVQKLDNVRRDGGGERASTHVCIGSDEDNQVWHTGLMNRNGQSLRHCRHDGNYLISMSANIPVMWKEDGSGCLNEDVSFLSTGTFGYSSIIPLSLFTLLSEWEKDRKSERKKSASLIFLY